MKGATVALLLVLLLAFIVTPHHADRAQVAGDIVSTETSFSRQFPSPATSSLKPGLSSDWLQEQGESGWRAAPVDAARPSAINSLTAEYLFEQAEGLHSVSPDGECSTSAELQRLNERNQARLYAVLWAAMDYVDSDRAGIRDLVLAALDERADLTASEILAALVRAAPGPEERKDALQLLAQASQELSVKPFTEALRDPDPGVRESALAFFDELSVNELLDAVTEALLERDQSVRLLAFSTLEEMHEFAPIWDVAELVVNDPDPAIRKRALELMTYGDREWAIEYLLAALDDPNPQVIERAEALLHEYEQGS